MKPLVSVIAPIYNEKKTLEINIEKIRTALADYSHEIIIVDGYSTDRTREIAAKYADKVIYQISKGVGGARNDGAREAKGRILVFTDADVVFPKNWLERIISYFEKDDDLIAVCGPDEPLEHSGKLLALYKLINGFSKILYKIGIVGTRGTNTAVRKDGFFNIGG